MAELLYNINFSRLSTPLHFSPRPHFCFTRFAPLRRRFSHSSILVKLSSASSQLDIISATENSDGSIIFKFGDASELSQSVEGFDVQNEEILESESNRNLALQDNAVTDDDDESDGTKADILVINSFQAKEIANEPVDSRIKSEFVSQSGEDSVVDEQISNTIPIANEPAPSYKTVSLSDAESSSDAVSDEQNSDLTSTANVDALVDSQIDPRFDVQSYEVSVSDFGEVESSSDFDTVELENQIINNMVATCDSYVEVVMIEKAEELTEVSEDMSVDDKLEYDGDELSVVLEEIKGSGKLEYRVDKIPVIASEDKIDGGDEMSVIASKAASVDGGEISTIASEEASDDGDKMLAIGSKEVSDDGDEAIASEEAILDGDEMSPIASEEANDDEMSAIASKDTTADDKLEYGGEESNTVASERSNGGAKVEYGGDDLPEETSDGCDKSLVNDSVEMKYADKVEYGGDTVSFVASKEINDGEEVEYVGDEILAIASEDTNDKVEYVGDETLAIASEDTVDKVEYVGDETLAIASEDTIDKIEYVGDKILAIASEDTNDKVEYVGDSASSFIVSEEINNGAKVEYVGDETLVIALGDSIDDDKVEYGGEETLAISSEEMIDGGKLECSNNDSLSIVPEEMVDDGKLDSGDVDSLNIASNETSDVRKVISVSEELSNISETSMVVQSEDEIVEPEADAVAADKEVELISPPLEAEPILDEERDFESLAGVITVASTLGFDKVHHMTTPSISQSDEFSDILLAAGPITSDINSVDFDSPNEVESSAPTFFITSAAASLSHSLEALTGGKDAYFVSKEWFGVADGVGQWSLEGIDVGLYAHELMQNCQKLLKSNAGITDVKDLFQQSDAMTQSTGSARVIIAHVANQVLHVANIGDTGFMIIRNGALFKKSSPMLHDFGFPYAIGLGDDSVEDVEEDHIELEGGDVIVTATDGLFDNLYEQEIVFTVSKALEAGIHVQELAELLATKAQEVGKSENTRSPFADAAQAAGHPGYSGGKFDHVTVIVSLVQAR